MTQSITIYVRAGDPDDQRLVDFVHERSDLSVSLVECMAKTLTPDTLRSLADKLRILPQDLVRQDVCEVADFQIDYDDDDVLFDTLSRDPNKMIGPIGVCGSKAVVCRPPERLLELLVV